MSFEMVQIISKKRFAISSQHSGIHMALGFRYLTRFFDVLIFKWRNSYRFYYYSLKLRLQTENGRNQLTRFMPRYFEVHITVRLCLLTDICKHCL